MSLRRRGYLVEGGERELSSLEVKVLRDLAKKKKLDLHTELSRAMATKLVKWGLAEWAKGASFVKVTRQGLQFARSYGLGVYRKVSK